MWQFGTVLLKERMFNRITDGVICIQEVFFSRVLSQLKVASSSQVTSSNGKKFVLSGA